MKRRMKPGRHERFERGETRGYSGFGSGSAARRNSRSRTETASPPTSANGTPRSLRSSETRASAVSRGVKSDERETARKRHRAPRSGARGTTRRASSRSPLPWLPDVVSSGSPAASDTRTRTARRPGGGCWRDRPLPQFYQSDKPKFGPCLLEFAVSSSREPAKFLLRDAKLAQNFVKEPPANLR